MTRTIKKRDRQRRKPEPSGYTPCECRDCMEIALGGMCWECVDAGCEPHSECKVERDGE